MRENNYIGGNVTRRKQRPAIQQLRVGSDRSIHLLPSEGPSGRAGKGSFRDKGEGYDCGSVVGGDVTQPFLGGGQYQSAKSYRKFVDSET